MPPEPGQGGGTRRLPGVAERPGPVFEAGGPLGRQLPGRLLQQTERPFQITAAHQPGDPLAGTFPAVGLDLDRGAELFLDAGLVSQGIPTQGLNQWPPLRGKWRNRRGNLLQNGPTRRGTSLLGRQARPQLPGPGQCWCRTGQFHDPGERFVHRCLAGHRQLQQGQLLALIPPRLPPQGEFQGSGGHQLAGKHGRA